MTWIMTDDDASLEPKVDGDKSRNNSITINWVGTKETNSLGMIMYVISWLVASLALCYLVFSLLPCSAVEINLWVIKFSHQTSMDRLAPGDLMIVNHLISITAIVAFVALFCWAKVQLVREQRLSKKEEHDFAVRQMDCCRELVNGVPQKDGTRRYEIVIGRKHNLLTGV